MTTAGRKEDHKKALECNNSNNNNNTIVVGCFGQQECKIWNEIGFEEQLLGLVRANEFPECEAHPPVGGCWWNESRKAMRTKVHWSEEKARFQTVNKTLMTAICVETVTELSKQALFCFSCCWFGIVLGVFLPYLVLFSSPDHMRASSCAAWRLIHASSRHMKPTSSFQTSARAVSQASITTHTEQSALLSTPLSMHDLTDSNDCQVRKTALPVLLPWTQGYTWDYWDSNLQSPDDRVKAVSLAPHY